MTFSKPANIERRDYAGDTYPSDLYVVIDDLGVGEDCEFLGPPHG